MKKFILAISTLCAGFALCAQEAPQQQAVACLGKISAGDTIARVAAPSPMGNTPIITKLFIKTGDQLKAGDKIAQIFGYEKANASYESAVASLNLQKSESELRLLRQKIEFEELAGTYNQNLEVLRKDPPRSEREKLEYEQKSIARRLEQSKRILEAMKQNEKNIIASAEVATQEALRSLDEFTVKAPISGEVIEVSAKLGEVVTEAGICEIANTDEMFVEAEVYVSDITKVKVGDIAECAPEAFESEILKGKVVEISPYVKSNRLFSQDPSEYADRKVILVKIKLDESDKVKNLIGSLVRVRIFVK